MTTFFSILEITKKVSYLGRILYCRIDALAYSMSVERSQNVETTAFGSVVTVFPLVLSVFPFRGTRPLYIPGCRKGCECLFCCSGYCPYSWLLLRFFFFFLHILSGYMSQMIVLDCAEKRWKIKADLTATFSYHLWEWRHEHQICIRRNL